MVAFVHHGGIAGIAVRISASPGCPPQQKQLLSCAEVISIPHSDLKAHGGFWEMMIWEPGVGESPELSVPTCI